MGISTSLHILDDALASQHILLFPEGIPGGGNTDLLSIRLDQSFDPPEKAVETYEIFYRGMKIPKKSQVDATDKTFQVQVRIDQNWQVIKDIEAWMDKVYNFIDGTALPSAMVMSSMIYQNFDGQGNVKKQYQFKGCIPKALQIGSSDFSSPDPLRATITFIFTDYVSL
jgi:hypothetical protein